MTSSYQTLEFLAMATQIRLSLIHPQADQLLKESQAFLLDLAQRFTAFGQFSSLQKINQAAGQHPVQVEADLYDLIKISKKASIDSQRRLNIAIGPLVKQWKIGFGGQTTPSPSTLKKCLTLLSPQDIELNSKDQSVFLRKKGMSLDLGGVAKGYFADLLKKYWIQKGVRSGLIDLGGNLLALAGNVDHPDGHWHVGIQDPKKNRGQWLMALPLNDQSLVTSGIYERHFLDPQTHIERHHILDSNTGYPSDSPLASVSVLSPQSLQAEIWSTRLFVDFTNQAPLAQKEGIEFIAITKDSKLLVSPGIKTLLKNTLLK